MSKVKPFILDPVDSLASHDATNWDEIKVFCSSFTLARIPTYLREGMEIKKDLLASSKKGSTERETQVLGEVVNLKKTHTFLRKNH